jgi:DNA-binding response OmpR family regulator
MAQQERLLIVDDDEVIAVGLTDYLELRGCTVDNAHDFDGAKLLVNRRRYGAALVDVLITGQDAEAGISFLRWLREASPQTVVILLTAYRTASLESLAAACGVARVFDKPKPFEEIAAIIASLTSAHEEVLGETLV